MPDGYKLMIEELEMELERKRQLKRQLESEKKRQEEKITEMRKKLEVYILLKTLMCLFCLGSYIFPSFVTEGNRVIQLQMN